MREGTCSTYTKGLLSILCKNSYKSVMKKTDNPIEKWKWELNRHFGKEDIQVANEYMKNCTTYSPGKCWLKP